MKSPCSYYRSRALVIRWLVSTFTVMFAQQAPVKRNFEAEIQTALELAKAVAGFEFLGTLVRTCLLPPSGGESTNDNVPGYVTNPATAPARDSLVR